MTQSKAVSVIHVHQDFNQARIRALVSLVIRSSRIAISVINKELAYANDAKAISHPLLTEEHVSSAKVQSRIA